MRLEFLTQILAQAAADSIHARMIASDPAYAQDVASGAITAWAKPYQDLNLITSIPINVFWYVNCKPRCEPVLTALEILALKSFRGG